MRCSFYVTHDRPCKNRGTHRHKYGPFCHLHTPTALRKAEHRATARRLPTDVLVKEFHRRHPGLIREAYDSAVWHGSYSLLQKLKELL